MKELGKDTFMAVRQVPSRSSYNEVPGMESVAVAVRQFKATAKKEHVGFVRFLFSRHKSDNESLALWCTLPGLRFWLLAQGRTHARVVHAAASWVAKPTGPSTQPPNTLWFPRSSRVTPTAARLAIEILLSDHNVYALTCSQRTAEWFVMRQYR
jgi:hypothetical protein